MGIRMPVRGSIPESSGYARLFNSKLKEYTPTSKTVQRVRILPGFDLSLSPADEAYPTSVGPYRNINGQLDAAGNAPLEGWFLPYIAYRFWGVQKDAFLSPATLARQLGEPQWELKDPINVVRRAVYRKVQDEGRVDLQHFYKRPQTAKRDDPRPLLTGPSDFVLFNALLMVEKNQWSPVLYSLSNMAHVDLCNQCDWPRPASEPVPRDSRWSDYLLGDPTDPSTGIVWTTVAKNNGTTDFNGLACGVPENARSSSSVEVLPVTAAFLAQRADLQDSDILRLPTFEEVVARLVEQPQIREIADIVEEALSPYCAVRWPARFNAASTAPTAGMRAPAPVPAPVSRPPAPVPPGEEDFEPVQRPAPRAPAAEPSYYMSESGSAPALFLRSKLEAMARAGTLSKLAMLHVDGNWVPASTVLDLSLWAPPPPPPAPAAPSAPPPPPAAPAAPSAPPAAAPVAQDSANAFSTQSAPAATPPSFTAEDAAEFNTLQEVVKQGGCKPEQMKRLRELITKKNRAQALAG